MIFLHLLFGPLLALLGFIFLKYAPKEINAFMGYRTYRSMKNQETWDYANRLSSKIILYVGILTSILQIILLFIFDEPIPILGASIVMTLGLMMSIFYVERQLKKKFPD